MFSKNNLYSTDLEKKFFLPTFLISGVGAINRLSHIVKSSSVGETVVVVDRRFKYMEAIDSLNPVSVFEVSTEPLVSDIRCFLNEIPKKECNVVAIGGGSAIDAAKAVRAQMIAGVWSRLGYGESRYLSDLIEKPRGLFIAVPTTNSTGSESSRYFLLTDEGSGKKTVSRSWFVCPDYAILDPDLLLTLSPGELAVFAFDSFIHLWETLFCRSESSPIVKMFARYGISEILEVVSKLEVEASPDISLISRLQYAGFLGGACLSNTRTGLIHTAGEALSSQCKIAHPLSLVVFFEEVVKDYAGAIQPELNLASRHWPVGIRSVDEVVDFWRSIFDRFNTHAKLESQLKGVPIDRKKLCNAILEDSVLMLKEHPFVVTEAALMELLSRVKYLG